MPRPNPRRIAIAAALSPLALVLSHNLAFLATYGAGSEEALTATGHDQAWSSAVNATITISVLLGMLALIRVVVLWRTARRLEGESGMRGRTDGQAFAGTVLATWWCLALITTCWFLLQENLERVAVGQPLPGLDPLLSEGPIGPLLIIPAISLIIALITGLFLWGITTLRAWIAAALAARLRRRPAPVGMPAGADPHRSKVLSLNLGLRAPPGLLAP